LEEKKELSPPSARITDALTKFQSISRKNFKPKRYQKKAVESMLMNQDVLVALPKYVIASGQRNNTKALIRLSASLKTRLPKQDHLE